MSKYQETNMQNAQNLSISCNSVPDALLDKTVAKNYFQQFGNVLRIRLRPKHKMVVVEYANEESAQNAYAEIGEFQGQDFIVSWTKNKSHDKQKVRKKLDDPNWSDDPDIKNELEAMKGNFVPNKNYNLRPEGMVIEQSQNTPKKMPISKISKTRQWKAEKPIKPKNTESLSDQENELLKTIMTCASTNEEKFRILDARDKLIRSRTVRQSELARAVRTIGTCPDMCPEKERLMREVQHQVAAYEQVAGSVQKNTMNHKLAVKQYSRSSADQESPLAHELRPVDVLHLTMGYLLHRIMDVCEAGDANLAEWYHFVWDRTRGIRKDITQQELCCAKSVQLVEQCARFHVHCAARLVAEDVSVFDDKINTENLTKCLQTLKYMYHDLRVAHGVSCPHEAEFRAYIVLLNLNDGNFMWEVQQLAPHIQRSREVRFALRVHSALDKNNYVRFFKLIKATTYLNACILLRYFNQVRFRALLTIIKSYSPRLPYPLVDLCQMLAFEDVASAILFLEYHGLQLNEDRTHVLLDRNRFRQPDTPFSPERAINVVESKRNTSVGQIVCGEPLPPKHFETHVPHDSFDEKGYLKISELPKHFQHKYHQFLKQFSGIPHTPEIPEVLQEQQPKKTFTFSIQKPATNTAKTSGGFVFKLPTETPQEVSEPDGEVQSFFLNSLKSNETRSQSPLMTLKNEASRSQSPQTIETIATTATTNTFWGKDVSSFSKNTNIFGNITKPTLPTIVLTPTTTIEDKELQQKLDEKKLLEKKLEEKKLLEEKLHQQKLLLQQQQQQQQQERQQQKEHEERLARHLLEQKQNEMKLKEKKANERKKQAELLYEKELALQLQTIAEEVFAEFSATQIKNRLQQISENIKMRKVLQYGRRWRHLTSISKKKRKNFFDHPVWVSSRSVRQQADELFTSSQNLTLHDIKRYKCGTPVNIPVKSKRHIERLDVYRIVWKILFSQLDPSESLNFDIFWKIGLSWPETENEALLGQLENCLELSPTELMALKRFKSNNGGSLNVCFKNLLQYEHTNGTIFFHFEHRVTETNKQRFQKVTYNKKQNNVPPPIVVLIKCKFDETTIIEQLNLQAVSKYIILQYTEHNFEDVLTKSLEFLAENFHETRNKLEAHELATILRNCLGDEFWHRIRSSMELNARFSLLLQSPNNVIDLYNEALKICWKILFDGQNYEVPPFPQQFQQFIDKTNQVLLPCTFEYFPDYWKSPSYLTKVKKIVRAFQLPKFEEDWPLESQQHFQRIIEDYCGKIFQENNTNIVYKIYSVVYRSNFNLSSVSWVDIIELIVLEKISISKFNDKKHPIFTVVYDVEEMREYRRMPWWFQLKTIQRGIKRIKYVEEFPEPEILVDVSATELEDTIDLDKTLNDIYKKQTRDVDDGAANKKIYNEYNELNVLLDDLEKSMEIQKTIMRKFEERALMAMDGSPSTL